MNKIELVKKKLEETFVRFENIKKAFDILKNLNSKLLKDYLQSTARDIESKAIIYSTLLELAGYTLPAEDDEKIKEILNFVKKTTLKNDCYDSDDWFYLNER